MTELELLARLLPFLDTASGELVIGAGEDDAAAWREPDGSFTVATCDTSVEGVHFDLERQQPEDVGWRALAFALGDLAAKGAAPTYGMAALSVPGRWDASTVEGVYRGLSGLAREVGLKLVGGDTTASPSHGVLTLALLGRTGIAPRPRSSVQAGWLVGVTGPLGGASLDLGRPRPLLARGAEIAAAGYCSGDISDGLLREMDKYAAASGLGASLRLPLIPCAEGVDPRRALVSGEEVELVSCGPPPLPAGLILVGELTSVSEVVVLDAQGELVEMGERGYDHFA